MAAEERVQVDGALPLDEGGLVAHEAAQDVREGPVLETEEGRVLGDRALREQVLDVAEEPRGPT